MNNQFESLVKSQFCVGGKIALQHYPSSTVLHSEVESEVFTRMIDSDALATASNSGQMANRAVFHIFETTEI